MYRFLGKKLSRELFSVAHGFLGCFFLQNALGVHDLGQLYHQHLKDDSGCILLTTVNYVRDPKHVALISGKWIPISKLQRRLSLSGSETSDASEMLLNSLSVR